MARTFVIKAGDKRAATMHVGKRLVPNGPLLPVDLTGATVICELEGRRGSAFRVSVPITVVDAVGGEISAWFDSTLYPTESLAGDVKISIGAGVQHTVNFEVLVLESVTL